MALSIFSTFLHYHIIVTFTQLTSDECEKGYSIFNLHVLSGPEFISDWSFVWNSMSDIWIIQTTELWNNDRTVTGRAAPACLKHTDLLKLLNWVTLYPAVQPSVSNFEILLSTQVSWWLTLQTWAVSKLHFKLHSLKYLVACWICQRHKTAGQWISKLIDYIGYFLAESLIILVIIRPWVWGFKKIKTKTKWITEQNWEIECNIYYD